jgi:hypothetical protein
MHRLLTMLPTSSCRSRRRTIGCAVRGRAGSRRIIAGRVAPPLRSYRPDAALRVA